MALSWFRFSTGGGLAVRKNFVIIFQQYARELCKVSTQSICQAVGPIRSPSSVKSAMTKDGQRKSGCTTPRALPSNDTSRLEAKLTRTIQPMKPTSKSVASAAGRLRSNGVLGHERLWKIARPGTREQP